MPIRPYMAPLIAVTGATKQVTCLIKTISATCDYTDWCNMECNINRYLQLTSPLPRERLKLSKTFNLQEQAREQTKQTTRL